MTRQIIFEAWHPASKTMFKWDEISLIGRNGCIVHETQGVFTASYVDANSVILRQYTGLPDVNNALIMEGDITKHCVYGWIAKIEWSNEKSCFMMVYINGKRAKFLNERAAESMVIGNIYQHPHFLKP